VRLADVLGQADGATKRFVHYLEARGHIQPRLIEKARIARRDYSDQDARRVAAIWTYHRRGVSVERAVALVDRGATAIAYVLFRVAPRRWGETLQLLRSFAAVQSAAIVYGEEADLIAELIAPDDGEVYAVLAAVMRAAAITSPPTILRTDASIIAEPSAREGESTMQAYVVVKASAKQVENTLERLRALDGIAEAAVVYGETDVICRVEVPDQERLDQLVMRELHEIPTVESTRTYIVVGGMSWRR
jgi:DNA-binding Lrp family transcriptional regulator